MLKKSLLIYYPEKIFFFLVSGRVRKERCLMLYVIGWILWHYKILNLPCKMALSPAVKWVNMRNVYSNICNMVSAIEMLIIIIAVRGRGPLELFWTPLTWVLLVQMWRPKGLPQALHYLRFSFPGVKYAQMSTVLTFPQVDYGWVLFSYLHFSALP